MTRAVALASLGLALALAGATASDAQSRHDTNAPIDVGAQHMELQDRANRALLTGDVVVKQAEMTLTAARVVVSYTGNITEGSPEISRLDASGGVTVTRPDQSARSEFAVYDINRRVITMVGGVTLTQGTNKLNGGRLSIDLDTGRATMDGSGVTSTAGAPGTVQGTGGRVTGRFSVPQRNTNTTGSNSNN